MVAKKVSVAAALEKYPRIDSKLVDFTPKTANEYLGLDKIGEKIEREINNKWVLELKEKMDDGTWLDCHGEITMARCKWNDELCKINGQHRCMARLLVTDPNFKPKMRVITYSVEDEKQLRELHSLFDNRGTIHQRTRKQLVTALLYGTPEFTTKTGEEVAPGLLSKLEIAIRGARVGMLNSSRLPVDEMCHELRNQCNKTAWRVLPFFRAGENKLRTKHLRKGPVCSAIFATMEARPVDATKFWNNIYTGTFKGEDTPECRLNDWLLRVIQHGTSSQSFNKQRANANEIMNTCIKCFNAFREGRKMKRVPTGHGPIPPIV